MKKESCNRIIRVLITVCFLISVVPLCAIDVKDFSFSHIGKSDGMGSQRVFSICQSKSGAIWWSSMTGVSRYNGSLVKSFRLDEGTPYGHLGGRVIRMVADSVMVYAFDNRGSIYRLNTNHEQFELVASVSGMLGHEVALNDMFVSDNRLYLAMHDGVYLMKDTVLTQMVKDVYVNRIVRMDDRLLFCSREGVYDEKGRRLLPFNAESGYYDELSGYLWIGGYENGLHIVSIDADGRVAHDEFVKIEAGSQQNPIRSICPYDNDTMLIGIDGLGVYQMRRDGKGGCSLLFDANDSVHGVLHGNGVYCIVVDNWKNIVVGTYSGGIDIARPNGSTTAVYRHEANNRQSLLNNHVNMVMPLSDHLLMMGTDNGISILNTLTDTWQHCCQGTVVLGAGTKPDGSVLVSTYGKGVYEIDRHAQVRHVYTTAGSLLTDDHVYATFYDRDGGLWVGSLNGDLLYKSGSVSRYYPVHDVQAIVQLASGQIAVGTAFGLKLITPGSDDVKDLNYAPSGVTDINPFVTHLLSSDMRLWIGTDGGGVYIYHLAKHESRQLTKADGLPSDYVRSLSKGKDGRIWIATDEGLSFVAPGAIDKAINVNYCYGLNCEYSRGAVANLSDGDIIFGTSTGAIIMHPENVQSLNYNAKLVFVGVSSAVEQERLNTEEMRSILAKGELHLSYRQRSFDLFFESVNMRNHFDIVYRYRVGQGEWSLPSDQQNIRFVNMEPGNHRLTLQCISRTNGSVIDTQTLDITIGQPWWNTWWMWCIYVALILLAFYGAWRVYQLHEKYMRLTIDHLQAVGQGTVGTPPGSQPVVGVVAGPAEPVEPTESAVSSEPSELVEPHAVSGGESDGGNDFVDKVTRLIVDHLSDSGFTIDRLCREMAMSRTLFYVKLKSYTGKSPQDFIRIIRLERASSMLRSGRSVTDAAAMTGFDNAKYFSTVFKKYFGVSPSKYC